MRAIVISAHGGPEVLTIRELPDPVPGPDDVLVRIKAFGLNRAELYMRDGSWGDLAPVPGIECAGLIEADPSGQLAIGTPVVAIMGGMGRSRNGTYAELVSVPAASVVAVQTALSWTDLVAIPEVYAAAWSGLHHNVAVQPGQSLLVRGATSALGQAAVNIASELGAYVIATTRSAARAPLLRAIGAAEVLIDDGFALAERIRAIRPDGVDAVLDLVGNNVLRDSLQCTQPSGRVCQMGFLGGHEPVSDFDLLVDLPSRVQLSFFASFVLGTEPFPLSDIPLPTLIARAEAGTYSAKPARVFRFDEIVEAHRVMEANQAGGKMVVAVT
jgi:NADPH2:quinone reductase